MTRSAISRISLLVKYQISNHLLPMLPSQASHLALLRRTLLEAVLEQLLAQGVELDHQVLRAHKKLIILSKMKWSTLTDSSSIMSLRTLSGLLVRSFQSITLLSVSQSTAKSILQNSSKTRTLTQRKELPNALSAEWTKSKSMLHRNATLSRTTTVSM